MFFAEHEAFLQYLHNSVKLSSLMDHREIQTAAGKINIIIIPAVFREGRYPDSNYKHCLWISLFCERSKPGCD